MKRMMNDDVCLYNNCTQSNSRMEPTAPTDDPQTQLKILREENERLHEALLKAVKKQQPTNLVANTSAATKDQLKKIIVDQEKVITELQTQLQDLQAEAAATAPQPTSSISRRGTAADDLLKINPLKWQNQLLQDRIWVLEQRLVRLQQDYDQMLAQQVENYRNPTESNLHTTIWHSVMSSVELAALHSQLKNTNVNMPSGK